MSLTPPPQTLSQPPQLKPRPKKRRRRRKGNYQFRPIQNDENIDNLNPPVIKPNKFIDIDKITFGAENKIIDIAKIEKNGGMKSLFKKSLFKKKRTKSLFTPFLI
jgi:hypothetical protein